MNFFDVTIEVFAMHSAEINKTFFEVGFDVFVFLFEDEEIVLGRRSAYKEYDEAEEKQFHCSKIDKEAALKDKRKLKILHFISVKNSSQY